MKQFLQDFESKFKVNLIIEILETIFTKLKQNIRSKLVQSDFY